MDKKICLFPYDINGNSLEESDIQNKFPSSYNYLLSIKNRLLGRSFDDKWFLFGRTQATKNSYGKKIVLSSLTNKDGLRFCISNNPSDLVYSGYYILVGEDTTKIEETLKDKNLLNFLLKNGKKMSGGWVSFSKKTLEFFGV